MKFLAACVALVLMAASAAAWPANDASAADSLLWLASGTLSPSATALLGEMRDAEKYGLRPRDYGADTLAARAAGLTVQSDPAQVRALDADISAAVAKFVTHLHSGRISPRAVGHDLDVPHATIDTGVVIHALAQSQAPLAVLADFEPGFLQYGLLRTALQHYRELAAPGEPAPLPPVGKSSIKPGDPYAGMPALRARLVQLGDLDPASVSGSDAGLLDPITSAALGHFQERHRLDVDGALGRATLTALNVPLSQRVRQIEFALERVRWLPPRIETPPIIVNIPQFQLFAFHTTEDRQADLLIMKVVVGKAFPSSNTPVFSADMNQLVLRPFWDVPRSILQNELLPQMKRDPNWVQKRGFEIVRGQGDDATVVPQSDQSIAALGRNELRLRQKPGPKNALGSVKFLFPNRYNVYLHDTPSQATFEQSRRAASHGCVRVSDPRALALYALRNNPGWDAARIDAAMNAETGTRIKLDQPIRVFLVYATALALADGRILFFEDIYHHDEKLAQVWTVPGRETGITLDSRQSLSYPGFPARHRPGDRLADPGAERSGVDVHEVGAPVVAHAAPRGRQRQVAQIRARAIRHAHIDRAAFHVQRVLGNSAARRRHLCVALG